MAKPLLRDVSKELARSLATGPVDFIVDTFTDANGTSIKSHVGDTKHVWGDLGSNGTVGTIENNRWRPAGNPNYFYANIAPPSANYLVEATFDLITNIADNIGIMGRAAIGATDYYLVRWASGGWGMFKVVNNQAAVQLGSTFTDAFTSGSRVVGLSMMGRTISMIIDGVERASVTDDALINKGVCGVRAAVAVGTATGRHITLFRANG